MQKIGLNVNSIKDQRIENDEIGIKTPNKLDMVVKLEDLTLEEKWKCYFCML